ncbi:MAG TPA: hypothetical protein PK829_14375 [Promineifilum sp.]|nr:hypothetical protein [Promineifilum sp.]HQF70721.1 hypothetical protein [Promineifilum sp.]
MSLAKRNASNHLTAGCFLGALAAAGGVTVILGVLGVGVTLFVAAPTANWIGLGFALVQSVTFIILAGLFGAAAGLVIAIVDHLVDGRIHDGRMPFWAWLPIGGAMGAATSVLLLIFPLDAKDSTTSLAFYGIMGAVCGLVAGPVFGLCFRQRRA